MTAQMEQHSRWQQARTNLGVYGFKSPKLPQATPSFVVKAPEQPEWQDASPAPAIRHYAPLDMLKRPGHAFIIRYVALKHDLEPPQLYGRSRVVNLVAARHEAIALVVAHSNMSLTLIGRLFGNLHWSTVIHAMGKHGVKRPQYMASSRKVWIDPTETRPTLSQIKRHFYEQHKVEPTVLFNGPSAIPIVKLRRQICQLMAGWGYSASEIGREIGFDRTSVEYLLGRRRNRGAAK